MHKYIKNAKNKKQNIQYTQKTIALFEHKINDNCKQIYYNGIKLINANAIMYMLGIGPVFLPTTVKG